MTYAAAAGLRDPDSWIAPWPEPPRTPQPTLPQIEMPLPARPLPVFARARKPVPPYPGRTPYVTNLEDSSAYPNYPTPRQYERGLPRRSDALLPVEPSPQNQPRYSWNANVPDYWEESTYREPTTHNVNAIEDDFVREKDDPPQPPKTKWQRYKRHLRRRWYFYVTALVIGMAIMLPILFLVVLPAIVQHLVNTAGFPLISVSLTNPGANSFTISLVSALNIPGGFSVQLDPMNLTLQQMESQGPGPVITRIDLPSYQLHGNTTLDVPAQAVTIQDHDAFVSFIHTAAVSESYQIVTSGESIVHMGALHTRITVDKTLTVPGFNKFNGFSVPEAQLLLTPEPDGSNIIGNATLPNPTVVSVELGNFTMNMMAGNIQLGTATVAGLTLRPGNNTVPLRGKLDIGTLADHMGEILQLQEQGLSEGDLIFNSTMNATTYDGVELGDFEKAFQGVTLTAALPIAEVVGDFVQGLLNGNSMADAIAEELVRVMKISDISSLL